MAQNPIQFGRCLSPPAMLRDPFSVYIQKNQVWNRLIVWLAGYQASQMLTSRNRYEVIERSANCAGWVFIGVLMPVFLDRLINPWYDGKLRQQFKYLPKKLGKSSLLKMPFLYTDSHGISERVKRLVAAEKAGVPSVLKELQQYGLSSFKQLSNPNLLRKIRRGKLGILMLDLLVMASKGQIFYWGKNWFTERYSGKQGFSGTLDYASERYRKQEAKKYEQKKSFKQLLSVAIGFGAACLLPITMGLLLKAKTIAPGKGVIGSLKALVSKMDYTDAIYMSKWGVFWHDAFNWTLPGILSSRDKNEAREFLVQAGLFYPLFYLGDELISGVIAKGLQAWKGKQLKNIPLVTYSKKGIPSAVRLNKVFEMTGRNLKNPIYRLAKLNFWLGLAGTSLCLIAVNLYNNAITQQKVKESEKTLKPIHKLKQK